MPVSLETFRRSKRFSVGGFSWARIGFLKYLAEVIHYEEALKKNDVWTTLYGAFLSYWLIFIIGLYIFSIGMGLKTLYTPTRSFNFHSKHDAFFLNEFNADFQPLKIFVGFPYAFVAHQFKNTICRALPLNAFI